MERHPVQALREVVMRPMAFGMACLVAADLALTGCSSEPQPQATDSLPSAPAPASSPEAIPTLSQTATVAPPSSTAPTAEQCAASLPVDFLAGQLLMPGLQASDMVSYGPVFKRLHIGGALLMSAPANPSGNTISRFKTASASRGVPLLIATDQEGGVVQRFTFPADGNLPAPQTVANTMTPALAEAMIAQNGRQLKAAGVDMVFGPLADVAPTGGESILGDRVFSDDPQKVSRYIAAYIQGWQSAGIIPTLKHFPGMGKASGNTDNQPATTPPLSELQRNDFVPYTSAAKSGPAVMVGSQNVPGWFTGPADLSAVPVAYLRTKLGYANNLLVTDALNGNAITAVIPESAAPARALAAGIDISEFVLPAGDPAGAASMLGAMESGIERAVVMGGISKKQLVAAVLRKLAAQHRSTCALTQP